MKNFFFLIVGIALILGSVYLFLQSEPKGFIPTPEPVLENEEKNEKVVERRARIGDAELIVELADTDKKRIQGLSARESLAEGRGMLFIFENQGLYGFWMKDMLFSIDIVWLDENLTVVGVEEGVSPETFPEVFYPDRAIISALELPTGFAEENGIDTGVAMYLEDENWELSPVGSE